MDQQTLEQLQQQQQAMENAGRFGAGVGIVVLVLFALTLVAWWRLFAKAGRPGWAAIVPIYNIVVVLQIVGRPVWWVVLMLIPLVNFVIAIVLAVDLAKSFDRSAAFGVGLLFLGFIFVPVLAFGSATYAGPAAGGNAAPAAA